MAHKNHDLWWLAELHRLKGAYGQNDAAESCYRQALSVAREQGALSLARSSSVSLGRLWQQQDERERAAAIVEGAYAHFTEGFTTPDLKEAKHLLNELF